MATKFKIENLTDSAETIVVVHSNNGSPVILNPGQSIEVDAAESVVTSTVLGDDFWPEKNEANEANEENHLDQLPLHFSDNKGDENEQH